MTHHVRFILLTLFALSACRTTKPGTHVEVIEKGGQDVYYAGAAGPGVSKTVACRLAVKKSAKAIALRFAQDHDDEADEIADLVGVNDGQVFMERFAYDSAQRAQVDREDFDPVAHLCQATVVWRPPVFVKDAVLKYAEALKQAELAGETTATAPVQTQDPNSGAAGPAPTVASPPPPPRSVAPPAPQAPAAPVVPACERQRTELARALEKGERAVEDFSECKRRTGGDEDICVRYKLYVDDAQKTQARSAQRLATCLNDGMSAQLRSAVGDVLPTHAGVVVENRDDGTRIVWAYSPVEQTAFAVEVSPNGTVNDRRALAANQMQWIRQKLGF